MGSLTYTVPEVSCPVHACPVCVDASPQTISRLASLLVRRSYRPGQHLVQSGDSAKGFFLIHRGLARVYRQSEDGRELSLVILEAGSIYGESCLFGQEAFSENVFVLSRLEAYFMPKEPFFNCMIQDPQLSLALAKNLTKTMQRVLNAMDHQSSMSAADRIMQFLQDLRRKQSATRVVLPYPKKEVALQLGMAPETFSRELHKLEQDRLIRVERRAIELIGDFST